MDNREDEIVFENGEYFKIVKKELPFSTEGLSKSEINKLYLRSLAKWEYYYIEELDMVFKVKEYSGKLYLLNKDEKVWIKNDFLYDEFMQGSFQGKKIDFDDVYKVADQSNR